MGQLSLPIEDESQWPETCVIVSLMPRYYHALVIDQDKRYEYRRGAFIQRPVTAFVYSTLSRSKEDEGFPRGEIGGVVQLGAPIVGLEEVIRVKETEEAGSRQMMLDWLKGFSTASAHPVKKVHRFKRPVSLERLRSRFLDFHPPQRYLVLNRKAELLEFLKRESGAF